MNCEWLMLVYNLIYARSKTILIFKNQLNFIMPVHVSDQSQFRGSISSGAPHVLGFGDGDVFLCQSKHPLLHLPSSQVCHSPGSQLCHASFLIISPLLLRLSAISGTSSGHIGVLMLLLHPEAQEIWCGYLRTKMHMFSTLPFFFQSISLGNKLMDSWKLSGFLSDPTFQKQVLGPFSKPSQI